MADRSRRRTCSSAAASPARTARAGCARRAREGDVLLVGREPDPPYNRPPCSKGYLQGHESREDTLLPPGEWWEEQRIELLHAHERDEARHRRAKRRRCRPRRSSPTTARCSRPARTCGGCNVDGAELDGIHYLRALGNADTIRADADGKRVVLIGGSYIGSEVAASLVAAEHASCTIVMQEAVTLARGFGDARRARFFQARARGARDRGPRRGRRSSASRAPTGA